MFVKINAEICFIKIVLEDPKYSVRNLTSKKIYIKKMCIYIKL